VAYGALFAGCTFFGGYPITPASEVAETMARELPNVDGYYVQFEDEIASMAAVIGAARAGARAMTATSGPGFSLMQGNIGDGIMTETPCVIVDVQRSGVEAGTTTRPRCLRTSRKITSASAPIHSVATLWTDTLICDNMRRKCGSN
jgi:2-oxoglutarate ferredoxin oxidoreductase subunit alpha